MGHRLKHGAGAAPDDDVHWSPLVKAGEQRCSDVVVGTTSAASERHDGGDMVRLSDVFTFTGARVANGASRHAGTRATTASAVVHEHRHHVRQQHGYAWRFGEVV